MTKDYEPTPDQRKMISAAIDSAIMPLIRQVLIKKLGQAAVFMKEEIEARQQKQPDALYTAEQLAAAVLAERLACAEVCDAKVSAEYATGKVDHNEQAWTASCAAAIRGRTV